MASKTRLKMGILSVSCFAIIYFGTTFGAELKMSTQARAEAKRLRALSVDDQIALLEDQKAKLRQARDAQQQRLDAFRVTAYERQLRREADAKRTGG